MDLNSAFPYWLIKNGINQNYSSLSGDVKCDVHIIGGGISGAMICHQLVSEGFDVVLTDARHCGTGSTSGSTALIQYETDTGLPELQEKYGVRSANRVFKLTYDAVSQIRELIKENNIDCELKERNSLYLASTVKDLVEVEKEFESRLKIGNDITFWDRKKIEKHFPFSAPGAIWSANGCEFDPLKFTTGLISIAKNRGARIFNNTFIRKIQSGRKAALAITSEGYRITPKFIVVACGYESEFFITQKFSRLKSTYAIISEPIAKSNPWYKSCLIWESARPYFYMRTTRDNRIIVGGKDEDFYNPVKRDKLLSKKAEQLEKAFKIKFPDIEFKTDFAWTGTFGESKDGLPYIGMLTPNSRIIFSIGFGGNGITFGQLAARLIPQLVRGRGKGDAKLFSFKR